MELWFNIKSGGWEEISGSGEEGAKGVGEAIAYQIVCSDFVDLSTLEDMITTADFIPLPLLFHFLPQVIHQPLLEFLPLLRVALPQPDGRPEVGINLTEARVKHMSLLRLCCNSTRSPNDFASAFECDGIGHCRLFDCANTAGTMRAAAI